MAVQVGVVQPFPPTWLPSMAMATPLEPQAPDEVAVMVSVVSETDAVTDAPQAAYAWGASRMANATGASRVARNEGERYRRARGRITIACSRALRACADSHRRA